jgi:hypothetical protein
MNTIVTTILAIIEETKGEIKKIFESYKNMSSVAAQNPEPPGPKKGPDPNLARKEGFLDSISREIIKYENVSIALSIMIQHFKDELFELKIPLIDDLLQKTINIINGGKSINLCEIKPTDIVGIFRGVQIYSSWGILTSFLYLNQKWINNHLKTIFALWQTHFVEGKLTLVKGLSSLENYVTHQSMIEACNSMLVFLQNCGKLYTDNILKYICLVMLQVFRTISQKKGQIIDVVNYNILQYIIYSS